MILCQENDDHGQPCASTRPGPVPARPAATWPALVATRSSSAQRVTGLNPKLGKRDERDRLAARDTGRFFRDLDQPVGGAQAGD